MKIEKLDYDDFQGYQVKAEYITRSYQEIKIKKNNKNK